MFRAKLAKKCGCTLRAYRLILMDLSMPVLSGEKAAEGILDLVKKETKEVEMPSIVAVTSHTNTKVK